MSSDELDEWLNGLVGGDASQAEYAPDVWHDTKQQSVSRARIEERTWDRLRPAYLGALGFVDRPVLPVTPFPTITPAGT